MGRATIAGGGTDGLFTIDLDYGEATRDALVFVLTLRINELTAQIAEQTENVDLAEIETQAARELANIAVQDYASAVAADPEGNHSALVAAVSRTTIEASQLAAIEAQARVKLDMLTVDRKEQQREKGRLESAVVADTKAAWCVDLTESASGAVATIEIPGEDQAILIAPGCRAPVDDDGQLVAREVMTPAQAFFNAAVLPGWQKWMPTYRKGSITAINKIGNLASVALDAAYSSAAGLGVNQAATLSNVPVVYMTCHAQVFEVGDRVVVEFVGTAQESPKVIGFVDHPKTCTRYAVTYSVGGYVLDGTGGGIYEPAPTISGDLSQLVYSGSMATTVAASSPRSSELFLGWTDGNGSLSRTDGPIVGPVSQQALYLRFMYEFGLAIVSWFDGSLYWKSVQADESLDGYTSAVFSGALSSPSPIPNSALIGSSYTLVGTYGGGSYSKTYTCHAAGVGSADFRLG